MATTHVIYWHFQFPIKTNESWIQTPDISFNIDKCDYTTFVFNYDFIHFIPSQQREQTEEQQQQQLDKLITSQTKARIALEKSHTKSLKRIAKVGEDTDSKQQEFKGELQDLLQKQEEEVISS